MTDDKPFTIQLTIDFGGQPTGHYAPVRPFKWAAIRRKAMTLQIPPREKESPWMHIHGLPDSKQIMLCKCSLKYFETMAQKDETPWWKFEWAITQDPEELTPTLWVRKVLVHYEEAVAKEAKKENRKVPFEGM